MRSSFALALSLAVITSALPAQGPPGGPPPGGRGGGRGGRGGRGGGDFDIRETADALNLSQNQIDRLRTRLDTRDRAEQAAQNDIQAKTDALAAAQSGPSPRTSAVDSAAAALQHAQDAIPPIETTFRADFMALLTDDQQKTLDAIRTAAQSAAALSRLGVLDDVGGRGGGPGRGGPPGIGGRPGGPGPGRGGRGGPAGVVDLDAPVPTPPDNPLTPEKVALGQQLFFNTKLSSDGTVSCATCHNPSAAFTDGRPVARGVGGQLGTRNAPTLVNAAFSSSYFWDGRARTIEQQVLQPIYNLKEMGSSEEQLERTTGMPASDVAAALASYVRTIRSTDSPYDQYQRGDFNALTALEKAGLGLFRGKANCVTCHVGPNFTDGQFHNTGVGYANGRLIDSGRFVVTQNPRDRGAFKTPTLRDVALTGPYMHDGSMATLDDVVKFYTDGGRRNPGLDRRIHPIRLSSGERAALVAFLKTLSGKVTSGTY